MVARSSLLRRPTPGARPARRTSSVVAALAALAPRLVRLAHHDYPDGLLALAGADESARAAARLAHQADRAEDHLAIDRLAHVVEGEAGDRDRGERLHLDAGACLDRHARLDQYPSAGAVGHQIDGDVIERQGVAERHQL